MKICKAKINGSWQEVPFYGIFQYSDVIGPSIMVGGHPGGVIAYPVAVVELENQLIMRSIDSVKDIKKKISDKEVDDEQTTTTPTTENIKNSRAEEKIEVR